MTVVSATGAAIGISGVKASMRVLRPLPPEHPFYAKIGRVAAQWAELEHTLDIMIFDLCRGTPQAEISCITGQLVGIAPRVRALTSLCELRGIERKLIKEIDKFSGSLFEFSQKRNRIVHDAWYLGNGDEVAQFRSQSYGKDSYGFKDIADAEIDALASEIGAKIKTMQALRARLWNALNPSAA